MHLQIFFLSCYNNQITSMTSSSSYLIHLLPTQKAQLYRQNYCAMNCTIAVITVIAADGVRKIFLLFQSTLCQRKLLNKCTILYQIIIPLHAVQIMIFSSSRGRSTSVNLRHFSGPEAGICASCYLYVHSFSKTKTIFRPYSCHKNNRNILAKRLLTQFSNK